MEGEASDNTTLRSCFVCYVCGDFFKRPRILPCGHTFCSECLAKLRDEIVNDGKMDTDQLSNVEPAHSNCGNGVGNKAITLYPDTSAKNGVAVHDSNGTSHDVVAKVDTGERKSSSSCVDDMDSIMYQSLPSSSTAYSEQCLGAAMPSSSTYTCLVDAQVDRRKQSPRNIKETKRASERSPSMVVSVSSKSKQCSHCGNVVSPQTQRNSSASPIKRSTSMTSTREQSPTRLRELLRWDNSSPHRRSTSHLQAPACSFEQKHGKEMGPFVCPIPQCNYSMRVMNLARWSPKNKALTNALSAWQRQHVSTQDCGTQTDISNSQSVLVTIPRSIVIDSSASSLMPLPGRKRHSSMVDVAIDQASSLDGPFTQPGYLPRNHYSWKSYAAMVGMNILQQILHL